MSEVSIFSSNSWQQGNKDIYFTLLKLELALRLLQLLIPFNGHLRMWSKVLFMLQYLVKCISVSVCGGVCLKTSLLFSCVVYVVMISETFPLTTSFQSLWLMHQQFKQRLSALIVPLSWSLTSKTVIGRQSALKAGAFSELMLNLIWVTYLLSLHFKVVERNCWLQSISCKHLKVK